MTIKYDIHENALTTDYIEKCDEGMHYKGHNGSNYCIVYYTYANCWGDTEHCVFGKSVESVLAKYHKLTGRKHDKQAFLSDVESEDDEYCMTTEDLAYIIDDIEA